MSSKLISKSSGSTSYFVTGRGENLVLIHGFLSMKETYLKLAPLLAKHFRVWAYDLIAHGESKPGPCHLKSQVQQLHAFLRAQGLKRVTLLGHSMGGGIAQAYAALYPQHVERLILISAADLESYPKFWNTAMHNWRLPGGTGKDWLFRMLCHPYGIRLMQKTPVERLVRLILISLYAGASEIDDQMVAVYVRAMSHPDFWKNFPKLFLNKAIPELEDLIERLEQLQIPVFVGWGREDSWFYYPQAEKIAAYYPQSEVVLFENTGHLPQEENPQEVARKILEWMSRRV